jgi:hypothetical protein
MLEEAIPSFSPSLVETPKALSSKNTCILLIKPFTMSNLIKKATKIDRFYCLFFHIIAYQL